MTIWKGIVCTNKIDSTGDSYRFSDELIKQLTHDLKGLPVTVNFQHDKVLGFVNGAEVTDKGLEVSVRMNNKYSIKNLYIVPAIEYITYDFDKKDGETIINDCNIVEFSLTERPVDTHLTPIERINDDETKRHD